MKLTRIGKRIDGGAVALATLALAVCMGSGNLMADDKPKDAGVRGGTPDGGVHALFTVKGRSDAPNCTISQPDFETQLQNHNLGFRIPTPEYGLGLVEAIQEQAIVANMNANASLKASLGIKGVANRS